MIITDKKICRVLAVALLLVLLSLGARGQETYDWKHLDDMIAHGNYFSARSVAEKYYSHAMERGCGSDKLTAAFYLCAIDYAYDQYPTDSAIMRYSGLARMLQGADRAVAYAFLYQSYSSVYTRQYYRLNRNKRSDDTGLKYPLWHLQRMEDSLMACVDSVVAYADELRNADRSHYSHIFEHDSLTGPALDSTLLGVLVQTLLAPEYNRVSAPMGKWLVLPLRQWCKTPVDEELPFTLRVHRKVAQLYADGSDETALWLDLRRLDACWFYTTLVAAIDSLENYYRPRLSSDEMRALLSLYKARYLNLDDQMLAAEQLCLETEQLYKGTYAAEKCRMLRYDICQSEFEVRYNRTESSRRHRLAVVKARNTSLMNFRLVKQSLLRLKNKTVWNDSLLLLPAEKEWQQTLPDPGDHLMHEYLVALPPVAQGDYYLVAYSKASSPDGGSDSFLGDDGYQSADATFIAYRMPAETGKYTMVSPSSGFLVDRVTGQPLAKRRVTMHGDGYITDHTYHRRCRTDKDGYFHFPVSSPWYHLIDYDKFSADIDGYEFEYDNRIWWGYYKNITVHSLDLVMIDRPIYRLGDTVHFCCVAYQKSERGSEYRQNVRPSRNLELTATFGLGYDGERDTLYLTTDKYGRCWGWFVVPTDGQNGRYNIKVYSTKKSGYYESHYIDVEAYRTPRFTVTLSTVEEGVDTVTVRRMGQPVTIYGMAASYSGAPMTGAKVKWEVSKERLTSPLQNFTVADEYPYSDSLMVEDDGSFHFTFTPMPDSNERGSVYVYTAYVRVTDADGELHESRLSLRVGDADGYCMIVGDDLRNLTYVYNNFDHQPMDGAVRVSIQQLKQPDTLRIIDPLMEKCPNARWAGSEAEFRKLFPHLAFTREEADPHHWPVVATCYDQSTTERKIDVGDLPSGMYRVGFLMPDGTRHDTLVNYVAPRGRVTGTDMVWLRTTPAHYMSYMPTIRCQVGDTVRIELGCSYGSQPLYYRFANAAKTYCKGVMVIGNNSVGLLEIPITDEMKDGCVLSLAAVRDGRMFKRSFNVEVVQRERVLDIKTETFRDRLQPGQQERWRLQITNSDSVGVSANMCLTMYDKSLEQYKRLHYGFWPWNRRNDNMITTVEEPHIGRTKSRSNAPLTAIYTKLKQAGPRLGNALWGLANYHKFLIEQAGPGSIIGKVIDGKTGEEVPFANVMLKYGDKILKGTQTDLDGNFALKQLPGGTYRLEIACVGYNKLIKMVTVDPTGVLVCNVSLSSSATALEEVQIVDDKVPQIEIGSPQRGARMSSDDIARMPGTSVESIVAAVGGVGYSRGEDGMVRMQGGVRKRTGVNVPKEAIAEIAATFDFDGKSEETPVRMRQNMSTLAFFEPALRSGSDGRVTVDFTLPDALTQWRLTGLAWTDDYAIGTLNRTIQAQKELMVLPQLPRFLRQGDTVEVRVKVSNLTDSNMTVKVSMEFADTLHSPSVRQYDTMMTIVPHSGGIAAMRLAVDAKWQWAEYKIYARAEGHAHHSDGEQGRLPVLSMKERVTTSHMLYIGGSRDGKEAHRTYNIPLAAPLEGDSLEVAFNASPIKYAIEALPHFKRHLMPGNIYLANSIYIDNITSQLPTATEKERNQAEKHAKGDLKRLLQAQNGRGGWSWMPDGSKASLYVTEAVLQRLAQCTLADYTKERNYYMRAVGYLDRSLVEQYKIDSAHNFEAASPQLSTLYTRSLWMGVKPFEECDSVTRHVYAYYYQLCRMRSMEPDLDLRSQGLLALLMLHMGDTADAVSLATRIKERAKVSDEKGMYWIENKSGYWWYQRPVENAALMVDVMADVLGDWESVGRIQQWILSSKRGTTWRTDMATASAVAALLRQPKADEEGKDGSVRLTVNGILMADSVSTLTDILDSKPSALDIELRSTSRMPAWGAVFYSHDTPIDSIQYNSSGIELRKTISRVKDDGSLSIVGKGDNLRVGERVRVHIDIYCKQDIDNLVLRDERAAGFEPTNTASGWRWNDGLRYYVDVRNERVDCYIDRLNEGHYYVEYDMWVRHSGVFAGGICSLSSVYAPEFRANTESMEVRSRD